MQRYFAHNAQKSCNITKSFLLQCNSLWQKLPKTLFFQCDLSRNDLSKAENEEKLQLFMSFPKIALHCFPSFHHTNLSPPSQNKTIAKKWIQTHRYRTYILLPIHTCAFVTRMRHFLQWFYFIFFIPTLLQQSLLRVSILPTAAPRSICYRFHRKQIRTVGLSTSSQVEYISLLHEFFQ